MHRHLASFALFFLAACPASDPVPGEGDTSSAADMATTEDLGQAADDLGTTDMTTSQQTVRVATFNTSLYRGSAGRLVNDLKAGDPQAEVVAQTIQRIRPDVVLLNEFDWDADGEAAAIFAADYLGQPQGSDEPIDYPYVYVAESNTGESSGLDLDNSGEAVTDVGSREYGNDSFGYGVFPGQYSMVVYSRFPIVSEDVRTFRQFRWIDMPDNLMPTDFYSDEAIEVFRLSSKNHIDVPVNVGGTTVHVLGSHPTPAGFDGPEDRNGARNHDEIRLWVDYVQGADYLVDDSGRSGGLPSDASFVVVGDLNNDPVDGDSLKESITSLLDSVAQDPRPTSEGGVEASARDGQVNLQHAGDPALDTADFSDGRVGNTRVDYVIPSRDLEVIDTGVFWPTEADDEDGLLRASDHRLVWVDVVIGG